MSASPPSVPLNLAHMIPLSAVWAGPGARRAFPGAAAVLRQDRGLNAVSLQPACRRCRPYADRRPTGAGKSVLLSLMAMQFRRYRSSQIFTFDFGGSIRAAALAMGGDWHDLGGSLSAGSEDSVFAPAAGPY